MTEIMVALVGGNDALTEGIKENLIPCGWRTSWKEPAGSLDFPSFFNFLNRLPAHLSEP